MKITVEFSAGTIHAEVLNIWLRDGTRKFYRDQNSTSGGTAFTFLQGACSLFDSNADISRVMLISNTRMHEHKMAGAVVYLVEIERQWVDVKGNPALIRKEKAA